MLQRTFQSQLEHIEVQGFDQIVVSAGFQRLHGAFHGGIGGHDHHRHGGIIGFDALEGGDAVHVGHPDVHKNRIIGAFAHSLHGFHAVDGGVDRKSPFAQQSLEHEPVAVVVVHHQQRRFVFFHD